MKDFEQELKRALRRCDPPKGFTDRVLAGLALEEPQRQPMPRPIVSIWHWPVLRWATVAAMFVIGAGGVGYRMHEQRVEAASGQAAKRQVMLALRITGSKLRVAQKKLKAVESGDNKTENTL